LRVKGLGREALGDDSVDRDPVLAALSAMGAHELCANARGQALKLSLEPRAVEEIVKRVGLGARGSGRCDPSASIVLQAGRGCGSGWREGWLGGPPRPPRHAPSRFPPKRTVRAPRGKVHKQCLKPRRYTASKSIGYDTMPGALIGQETIGARDLSTRRV